MRRNRLATVGLVVLTWLVLIPATAHAQSAIAGVARDASGGVMPGVNVEASSPALIEKVRTVVTDGQGQYKIVDLRPGTYTVTFTLPGFNTVRREGIELPTDFTANVNAELVVGSLEETVVVSGQSPVVDIQNVVGRRVLNAQEITALPTARTFQTIGTLTPGMITRVSVGTVTQDVGGSAGDANQPMMIHGGRPGDQQILMDGLYFNNTNTTNQTGVVPDMGTVQEASYTVDSIPAEYRTGGVHVNLIPKEGGNRYTGSLFGAFANHSLQSENISDDLRQRGLGNVNKLDKVWDFNPSFGGPIKRDKLWFFTSFRHWGQDQVVANVFYNKTAASTVYTPDPTKPLIDDTWLDAMNLRLTWQVTPRNKISIWGQTNNRCFCHNGGTSFVAPETTRALRFPESHMETVNWRAPLTNRLLLEAGFADNQLQISFFPAPDADVKDGRLPLTEQSTSLNYRSRAGGYTNNNSTLFGYRASVSYVTGSHNIKVGAYLQNGWVYTNLFFYDQNGGRGGAMALTLLNGAPRSMTLWTTPYESTRNLDATLGIYAQDQWTLKRMTLNVGTRYDYLSESIPPINLPATRFVGERNFAEVKDIPKWNDIVPRLGVSYDLFGTGKTALKFSLNKYIAAETSQFSSQFDPVLTSVNSATRTWTDLNGDFVPQCDFSNPATNAECGPLSPSTFGTRVITTRVDDDVRKGWGKRGYNWELTAGVNHELLPRMAVNAVYIHRSYGNQTVTDNLNLGPSDYDTYCVTAPKDSRLPDGGGYRICGLYDINPAKFSTPQDNVVTFAKNFGHLYEYWQGVDLTLNARLQKGITVQGGVDIGQRVSDNCDVIGKVNNPAVTNEYFQPASPSTLYCHQSTTLWQGKALAVYPLPWWGIQASATYQRVPGPPITAARSYTNAEIAPELGRNLASGVNGTATVHLIQPGTQFDTTTHQVDLRFSKIFKLSNYRIQGNFDLYNAFNASPVLLVNGTYGPSWLVPQVVLPGRLLKFGAQIDF